MSKKEVLKAEEAVEAVEAVEVMQATGAPVQETEGAGVVMATEIIADLKEQLQEAKEETKAVTEDWMLVLGQREILRKKMDIINFVLKFHDYKCLEMAQNFVRAAYNQQPPEEEEEQEGEE